MIALKLPRREQVPSWVSGVGGGLVGGLIAALFVTSINPLYALLGFAVIGVGAVAVLLPAGRFWLLAGLISLLPFAIVPFRLGYQPPILDVLLALLLGVALVRYLARAQAGVSTPLDIPILVYIGLCCVSFVFGTAYGLTGDTMRYFITIIASILLFFALTNGLSDRKLLGSLVNALILGIVGSALLADGLKLAGEATAMRVLSALGPLGYPTGGDVLRFIASTDIWRATSTSVDPNIFGGLLMIGLILLLGRLLEDVRSRRLWLLAAPGLALMGWALLLSYSRGAWVGLTAGVGFLVLVRYRKALPVVFVAGVVAVVALGNSNFGQHLVSGFLIEDKASAMRIGEYKDALNFISQYPFFGVGFGTTPNGASAVTPEADIYVGVSNIYLIMALEIGLVGIAGFAAVMATGAVWAWRRFRSADLWGKNAIAIAGAALFAAGVAGIADHYFFRYPHMIALFWSLVAILAVSTRLSKAPPSRTG
ncbi:MAG: O-antigen ligase family protein [Chloroflexi bacterium]|nr:O-antigen ligase family protein [Chloroflexota bacterium]